jgi:hypothetical protein
MTPYTITWWTDMSDPSTEAKTQTDTFEQALAILPYGPDGWERYLITRGKRFVERGDPVGPRGAPAKERFR